MPARERTPTTDVTVETACPLDCPDGCSLSVTVSDGRVVEIDGSHTNPATRGYICAKVRRFDQRVYGDSRVRFPMVRSGDKGSGKFSRVSWEEAIEAVAQAIERTREASGAESILPFCYGGSNGLVTQDNTDAAFFRRLGASRLLRTVCAAPTGAANMGLYGKMPSVTYLDYPHARLIVMWGMNPSASGIHAIPFIKEAQKAGAKLVVDRPARDAARQDGGPAPGRAARHRSGGGTGPPSRAVRGRPRRPRVSRRARDRRRRVARARRRVDDRASRRGVGTRSSRPAHVRRPVRADTSGAGPLRLGRRAQSQRRQRRRGDPGLAGRRAASSACAAAAMR